MFGLEASPLMATRVHEVLQHALADGCSARGAAFCAPRAARPAAAAAAGPRSRDSLERGVGPPVHLWPPARR